MKKDLIKVEISDELVVEVLVDDPLIVKVNKVLKGRATICGGALRSYLEGNSPRDIDIFMKSDCLIKFKEVCEDLFDVFSRSPFELEVNTEYPAVEIVCNATGVIISIIIPKEFYGRPSYGTISELVKDFDFNVCRLGLREDNTIYSAEPLMNIISDIENKTLRIIKERPEETERVKKRITKYESYGYLLKED